MKCGHFACGKEVLIGARKYCDSICKERARYYRDRDKRVAKSRDYYVAHKETAKARTREWVARNAERSRAIKAAYERRNPAKAREAKGRYRKANPEKIYIANRNWAAKNMAKRCEYTAKRKAAEKLASPKWANREAISKFYELASMLGAEVDHIVPLRSPLVCGLHVEHNLQVLTRRDNARKSNRYWPGMPA